MTPIGILLAAGSGTRFDPTGTLDKLLAPLPGTGGTRVAASAARRMLGALPRVVAVVRPGREALRDVLADAGCEILVAPEAARGMGAALAAAVRATPSPGGWVVGLADMPWVEVATIAAIVRGLQGTDRTQIVRGAACPTARPSAERIVAPLYEGRRGHPVAFGASHGTALSRLDGDIGARGLLQACPVQWLETDDGGVLADVDTAGDLAHAVRTQRG